MEACADESLVPITGSCGYAGCSKPFTIIGDDPRVDVLTVAATITFERVYPRRVTRRIAGVRVPYLNREDLIKSKDTGRPQDLADIERLKQPE